MKYLLIVLCGGAGSLARYLTGTAIAERFGARFSWGTLAVNVSGSFLIGLVMTLLTERLVVSPNWRFALVVGFLGGYTTFSSFEWRPMRRYAPAVLISVLNVAGSVVLGYAAVWLGAALARK